MGRERTLQEPCSHEQLLYCSLPDYGIKCMTLKAIVIWLFWKYTAMGRMFLTSQ